MHYLGFQNIKVPKCHYIGTREPFPSFAVLLLELVENNHSYNCLSLLIIIPYYIVILLIDHHCLQDFFVKYNVTYVNVMI